MPCSHTTPLEYHDIVEDKAGRPRYRPPTDAGICQQWVPLQLTVYANLRSSSAYTRSGWGRARTRAYPLLHRVITSRQVGSHDLRHIQFLLPPLLSYSRLFLTSQTTSSSLQPYHFNSTFYYSLPPYSICFSIANTNTLFS